MRRAALPRIVGPLLALFVGALLLAPSASAGALPSFSKPRLIGFVAGDDWEPSVASDGRGDVYVLWAHFGGVPGCAVCGSPAALLEISRDGGATFGAPKPIYPSGTAEIDFTVAVNATGVVFASYLFGKSTVVQRSFDRGVHWTAPTFVSAGIRGGVTDKPELTVRGADVYVAFDLPQHQFVAVSHNGGASYRTVAVASGGTQGVLALSSGGFVAPNGWVYFSWVGVPQSGNALAPQFVYLTRSTDGGLTWRMFVVDRNLPPGPPCGYPQTCGWDFLGPQMVIGEDGIGRIYALYNAGTSFQGAPRLWLRTSVDAGAHWSARTGVSSDRASAWHVFPAIAAGPGRTVALAWMDNSTGAFNVWVRVSSNGGASFSSQVRVSQFRPGFAYVTREGFAFPYGDYMTLVRDPAGVLHAAWGEGPNWVGPGNVLYAHD